MKRASLAVLVLGLAGAMASLPASADTLFTTLGPGGSFDTSLGWVVSGSDFDSVVIGNSFTLGSAADITDAVLALGNVSGDNNPITLTIESDSGGSPDSVLTSLTQVGTIPSIDSTGLVTFTCSGAGCGLAAGNYWLIASESDPGTFDGWMDTYNGATTNLAQGSDVSPLSVDPDQEESAFEIDGGPSSITPEPSSFLLLGSGLLGLAGVVRRKLKA